MELDITKLGITYVSPPAPSTSTSMASAASQGDFEAISSETQDERRPNGSASLGDLLAKKASLLPRSKSLSGGDLKELQEGEKQKQKTAGEGEEVLQLMKGALREAQFVMEQFARSAAGVVERMRESERRIEELREQVRLKLEQFGELDVANVLEKIGQVLIHFLSFC